MNDFTSLIQPKKNHSLIFIGGEVQSPPLSVITIFFYKYSVLCSHISKFYKFISVNSFVQWQKKKNNISVARMYVGMWICLVNFFFRIYFLFVGNCIIAKVPKLECVLRSFALLKICWCKSFATFSFQKYIPHDISKNKSKITIAEINTITFSIVEKNKKILSLFQRALFLSFDTINTIHFFVLSITSYHMFKND